MRKKNYTLTDIAKALKISTSTVSRALNNSYQIGAKTKKKVLNFAKKINYHSDPIAIQLRSKKNYNIGLIVPNITNSFFYQIIYVAEKYIKDKGYNLIIAQSFNDILHERKQLEIFANYRLAGCLISTCNKTYNGLFVEQLRNSGMKMVLFDSILSNVNATKVTSDNFDICYKATKHLINKGYKRIGCLCNSSLVSFSKERTLGYSQAINELHENQKEYIIEYCEGGELKEENVFKSLDNLIKKQKIDSILICSDTLTLIALEYFYVNKIKIAGDIGVIGFSNAALTKFLYPPLSVIKQSTLEMGHTIAEKLIESIENNKNSADKPNNIIIKSEFIPRKST